MKKDKVLKPKKKKLGTYLKRNYDLYLMLLPTLIFVAIFDLAPMYGILLAFKDYNMFAAETPFLFILASEWVGFEHFAKLFGRSEFLHALRNTLIISFSKIIFVFPVPIAFAILLS